MNSQDFEYEFCLSYASEQRRYVEQVAAALRDGSARVFYDHDERARLWGKNLLTTLEAIYSRKSRYCIVFCSKEYVSKSFTKHEFQSAQVRVRAEGTDDYILPARFDDSVLPGLSDTTTYIDIRGMDPKDLAQMALQRLRGGGPDRNSRRSDTMELPDSIDPAKVATIFQHDNPETNEMLSMVARLPLTQLWIAAVRVQKATAGFVSRLVEILSEGPGFDPRVKGLNRTSFVVFCRVVDRIDREQFPDCDFSPALVGIVSNPSVALVSRAIALRSLLKKGDRKVVGPVASTMFSRVETGEVSLGRYLIQCMQDGRAQADGYVGMVAQLWCLGSAADRKGMARDLVSVAEAMHGADVTGDVEATVRRLEKAATEDDVRRELEALPRLTIMLNEGLRKYREANFVIDGSITVTKELSREDALRGWIKTMPEFLDKVERAHGSRILYDTLVEIVLNPRVDAIFSVTALWIAVSKFGLPILDIDSDLLNGLVERKVVAGTTLKYSVVEAMCSGVDDAGGDESAVLLAQVGMRLSLSRRRTAAAYMRKRFAASARIQRIAELYAGGGARSEWDEYVKQVTTGRW